MNLDQKLQLRFPSTPEDMDVLASLNELLIRDEGHRNPMNRHQLRKRMKAWLGGEYEAAIVTSAEGVDVAYALWADRPEHLYLRQFFVVPEARRRGVGTAAFSDLRSEIWPKGKRLRLDVLSGNVRAIGFWKSLGFENYALIMEQE